MDIKNILEKLISSKGVSGNEALPLIRRLKSLPTICPLRFKAAAMLWAS